MDRGKARAWVGRAERSPRQSVIPAWGAETGKVPDARRGQKSRDLLWDSWRSVRWELRGPPGWCSVEQNWADSRLISTEVSSEEQLPPQICGIDAHYGTFWKIHLAHR